MHFDAHLHSLDARLWEMQYQRQHGLPRLV